MIGAREKLAEAILVQVRGDGELVSNCQVGHRWERGQYVRRNMREDGVCTEAGRLTHVEGTRDILSGLLLLLSGVESKVIS